MKQTLMTIGGILLGLALISAVYFGTFKDAATNAATSAKDKITTTLNGLDLK